MVIFCARIGGIRIPRASSSARKDAATVENLTPMGVNISTDAPSPRTVRFPRFMGQLLDFS
jgi:hypothetical protein